MSRKNIRRFMSFMLAVALVTSMSFGGISGVNTSPVGTAEAKHNCGITDALVTGLTLFWTNHDKCLTEHGDTQNMTSVDLYSHLLGVNDQSDAYLTQQENWQKDSRSLAWSKAKITVVNELNNESSKSSAKVAANETVTQYYSKVQYNLLQQYNSSMHQVRYAWNASNAATKDYTPADRGSIDSVAGNDIVGWAEVKVPLTNGTDVWVLAPIQTGGTYNNLRVPFTEYTTGNYRHNTVAIDNEVVANDIISAEAPDSSYTDERTIDYKRYNLTYSDLETQEMQVRRNIDTYVDSVYTKYGSGELNASDIVDPELLAMRASTDYNSTGYYGFAAVELAAMGLEGQMNTSFTVYFEKDDYSQDGYLFYSGDDVDTFVANETYDPSAMKGTVWYAWQNGNKSGVKQIKQNFTVEEIRNVNPNSTHYGESMNNTTLEHYAYKTHNASNLAHQLEQMRELRKEYEDQQTTSSGGGASDEGSWPFTPTETAAGAGVLAAVSYFLRSGAA